MSWKDRGNENFRSGMYADALACYNRALEDDKENAVLYRYLMEVCKTRSFLSCRIQLHMAC